MCMTSEAFGRINDTQAVEPLNQALKDVDWHVRLNATVALGEINDSRALEPLIQALKDWSQDHQGLPRWEPIIQWDILLLEI